MTPEIQARMEKVEEERAKQETKRTPIGKGAAAILGFTEEDLKQLDRDKAHHRAQTRAFDKRS